MHIHGTVNDEFTFLPDIIQYLFTRPDPARRTGQKFHDIKFNGCQFHLMGFVSDLMFQKINTKIPKTAQIIRRSCGLLQFRSPARNGLDPGNQDLGTKWLGDIIIRAHLKANNDVRFLAFGGKHDNGDLFGVRIVFQ